MLCGVWNDRNMSLIYITGVPGSGKSTVREELLSMGYRAYDGAEDNLAGFYDIQTDKRLGGWPSAEKRTPEWNKRHTWKIPRETVQLLKNKHHDELVFLCAITRNDKSELWDLFDTTIALIIDEETLKYRLATRNNNDVGKTEHELNTLIERQKTAKEEYKALGAYIIDATQPLGVVMQEIIKLAKTTR